MNEKEQLEYDKLKREVKKERRYKMAVEQVRKEVRDKSVKAKFGKWKEKEKNERKHIVERLRRADLENKRKRFFDM